MGISNFRYYHVKTNFKVDLNPNIILTRYNTQSNPQFNSAQINLHKTHHCEIFHHIEDQKIKEPKSVLGTLLNLQGTIISKWDITMK